MQAADPGGILPKTHLDSAQVALEHQNAFRSYDYLSKTISARLRDRSLDALAFKALSPQLRDLEVLLIKSSDWESFNKWVLVSSHSLLSRLCSNSLKGNSETLQNHLVHHLDALYEQLKSLSVPASTRISCIEQRLLLRLERDVHTGRLILALGAAYLEEARAMDLELSFEQRYRLAAGCISIASARGLADADPAVSEKAFLTRIRDIKNYSFEWVEPYLFPHETERVSCVEREERCLRILLLAERLIDYEAIDEGFRLYSCAADFAVATPGRLTKQILERYHLYEQDSGAAKRPKSWQQQRQLLQELREASLYLFAKCLNKRERDLPRLSPEAQVLVTSSAISAGFNLPIDKGDLLPIIAHQKPGLYKLQALLGDLIGRFCSLMYDVAQNLTGPPPCAYSLAACGSLARGELTPYSDLDAICIVERDGEDVISYFQLVGSLFELIVISLGETSFEGFLDTTHLEEGFHLDAKLLNPRIEIGTCDRFAEKQSHQLRDATSGLSTDLNVYINALRITKHIGGSHQLHDQYQCLVSSYMKKHAQPLGDLLLSYWSAPPEAEEALHVKEHLYRPITLLIDAMAVRHGVEGMTTIERLHNLQGALSPAFVGVCRGGLELAIRLRIEAGLEGLDRARPPRLIPSGRSGERILSYHEQQQLRTVRECLFKPCPSAQWEVVKAPYLQVHIDWDEALGSHLRTLISEGLFRQAEKLSSLIDAPPQNLRLYRGDLSRLDSIKAGESLQKLAHSLTEGGAPLRAVSRLIGYLAFAQKHGLRTPAPNPPPAAFTGSTQTRRRALWVYLTTLSLCEQKKAQVWKAATNFTTQRRRLPEDEATLLASLGAENRPSLIYSDVRRYLRQICAQCHTPHTLLSLFRALPYPLRPLLIQALSASHAPPALIYCLSLFPLENGRRLRQEPLLLDLEPIKGCTSFTVTPLGGKPFGLSEDARALMRGLLAGRHPFPGRHAVDRCGDFFIKLYPEFPGRAFTYALLSKLVTGESYPLRQLVMLTTSSGKHPVTISRAVRGPSLRPALERDGAIVERLEPIHLQWQIILALLSMPEDGSPDNYVLEESHLGTRAINIDPDRVFFSAFTGGSFAKTIQCKCILFCFPQMLQPLHPYVREAILSLDLTHLFQEWLDGIEHYNQEALRLFGRQGINRCLKRDSVVELLYHFRPCQKTADRGVIRCQGFLLQMYQRFSILQQALGDDARLSPLDLLQRIEPQLADQYRTQLDVEDRPAHVRFDKLTFEQYDRIPGETFTTTSTILRSSFDSLEEYERHGWTAKNARADLQSIRLTRENIPLFLQDLIDGSGELLQSYNWPNLNDTAVQLLDFSAIPGTSHAAIIRRLVNLKFRRLRLRHCQALTDRALRRILKTNSELIHLDISGSKGVTHLSYIAKLCPHLRKLNVRNIATLASWHSSSYNRAVSIAGKLMDTTITFPHLTYLGISHLSLRCKHWPTWHINAPRLTKVKAAGTDIPLGWLEGLHQREYHVDFNPYDRFPPWSPLQRACAASISPTEDVLIQISKIPPRNWVDLSQHKSLKLIRDTVILSSHKYPDPGAPILDPLLPHSYAIERPNETPAYVIKLRDRIGFNSQPGPRQEKTLFHWFQYIFGGRLDPCHHTLIMRTEALGIESLELQSGMPAPPKLSAWALSQGPFRALSTLSLRIAGAGDEVLRALADYCPQLSSLTLHSPLMGPEAFEYLCRSKPPLVSLHMFGWQCVSDCVFKQNIGHLHHVREITLPDWEEMDLSTLNGLGYLDLLRFSGNTRVYSESPPATSQAICAHLDLTRVSCLNKSNFASFEPLFRRVQRFDLHPSVRLSEAILLRLDKSSLSHIDLSPFGVLSAKALEWFASPPSLPESISIPNKCSGGDIFNLVDGIRKGHDATPRRLFIHGVTLSKTSCESFIFSRILTNVEEIGLSIRDSTKFFFLGSLSHYRLKVSDFSNSAISGWVAGYVFGLCSYPHTVVLRGCTGDGINDSSMVQLLVGRAHRPSRRQQGPFKQRPLLHLDVSRIGTIGAPTFRAIANTCRDLEILNLSDTAVTSDELFRILGNNCRLRALSIANCDIDAGRGLTEVWNRCPNLQYLDIRGTAWLDFAPSLIRLPVLRRLVVNCGRRPLIQLLRDIPRLRTIVSTKPVKDVKAFLSDDLRWYKSCPTRIDP